MTDEAEKSADEHWAWFVTWLEKMFKDGFVHGYKHGVQGDKE